MFRRGFPGGSDGKESACNAGDAGSISGARKIPGRTEWLPTPAFLGFPCGSAGKKNLLAMWKTWVRSLGWEDPLEKVKAACSIF